MVATKNITQRIRLNKPMEFTEDFRKRFITREYGNYDKYEKNEVKLEHDRGEKDVGSDWFAKNSR